MNPLKTMKKRKMKGLIFGMCASALGTLGVFMLILSMNNPLTEKEDKDADRSVAFEVTPPKPPPAPKKTPKKRKNRVKKAAQAKAPAPMIQSALRGASFDLPSFENGFDSSAADSLLGDELASSDLVMNASSVDNPPRPASNNRPPRYPNTAAKEGITGTVVLKLVVKADGTPERVRVIKSSPPGIFEDAAIQAVRHWIFEPATYQGKPVSMEATLPIHFERG